MRHPGVPQKLKMGPREMNSKMVVVVVGPALSYDISPDEGGAPEPGGSLKPLLVAKNPWFLVYLKGAWVPLEKAYRASCRPPYRLLLTGALTGHELGGMHQIPPPCYSFPCISGFPCFFALQGILFFLLTFSPFSPRI